MIPTTKSKAKEENNQGPIKETSKWAQQSDLSGSPTDGRQAVQRQEVRVHLQQLRQQREGREEDQAQGAVACIQCDPVDPKEAAFVNDDVDGPRGGPRGARRAQGSQGVSMRPGKSGLRATFDTTLSEFTIKDFNVICATMLAPK